MYRLHTIHEMIQEACKLLANEVSLEDNDLGDLLTLSKQCFSKKPHHQEFEWKDNCHPVISVWFGSHFTEKRWAPTLEYSSCFTKYLT